MGASNKCEKGEAHSIAKKIDAVLFIIDETRGFASLSHGVRSNLEEASDLLEEIRSLVGESQ